MEYLLAGISIKTNKETHTIISLIVKIITIESSIMFFMPLISEIYNLFKLTASMKSRHKQKNYKGDKCTLYNQNSMYINRQN